MMEKKRQLMLMVGGSTVGAWVLLVMAIMGRVWMEVDGRGNVGHIQEGLTTQRDMPEYFLCAKWEHRCHIMGRMPCRIFV